MKRVLIIHTGGTFGMTPVDPDRTLQPGNVERNLDIHLPAIHQIADISIKIPFNLDSSNIGPSEWKILYQIINKEIDAYDGIVIIHGTDTLVYTAAALSYLFLDLNKPIILTGSQRPLSEIRTDAKGNLINSVELATREIPEVLVCFGDKLLRGNRTKKISIESFQSFESPNYPPLAKIGLNVQVYTHYLLKQRSNIVLKPEFCSGVLSLRIYPGLEPDSFFKLVDDSSSAIILEGLGAGNLPAGEPDWIDFISQATIKNTLVFISSQSPHGVVDLKLYSCGRQAEKSGAVSLRDMTTESALVKLMILLANIKDLNEVQKYMKLSLAGEIS